MATGEHVVAAAGVVFTAALSPLVIATRHVRGEQPGSWVRNHRPVDPQPLSRTGPPLLGDRRSRLWTRASLVVGNDRRRGPVGTRQALSALAVASRVVPSPLREVPIPRTVL